MHKFAKVYGVLLECLAVFLQLTKEEEDLRKEQEVSHVIGSYFMYFCM